MVRGQPDYGLTGATPVASGISDPGEAAARLGSINVYDRRGWTVWMDNFESPVLKWDSSSSAGGTLPVLSTTQAWMGVQSCYFVTAAVAAEYTRIIRRFPFVRRGKVGIEFWIWLKTLTPNYLSIDCNVHDGVNISYVQVGLDSQAKTANIWTDAGHIVVAENCFNTVDYEVFIPVKVVFDVDTDMYTRLMIGPDEIDISTHALFPVGATTMRYLLISVRLWGGIAGIGSAYVDNFILTQNEP